MSLKELASCDLVPSQEWFYAGAQAVRDTVTKRTGAASLQCPLLVANANAQVYGWGPGYSTSYAPLNWMMCAFRISGAPLYDIAYGPIHNIGALGAQPSVFGIPLTGHLALYSASLNQLAISSSTVPTGSWQILLTEWDKSNGRVRAWLWNSATGVFDLWLSYSGALPSLQIAYWGFFSLKTGGTLSFTGHVDDILWIDNQGGPPNTIPISPAECYAGFPISGTPTHTAWTGTYADVDDLAAGGSNDGDTTKVNSGTGTAEVKETFEFTAGICPGTRPIVGIGTSERGRVASGSNGVVKHLLIGDGVEVSDEIYSYSASYSTHAKLWSRTPSGQLWTPALVDGLEYGLVRESGASDMRDYYCTDAHIAAAECKLADLVPNVGMMGLSPAVF